MAAAPPKLVVGLGNPGKEYAQTRHNVGFLVIDELGRRLSIDNWKNKHGARQAYDAQRRLLLIQPQTYMNNSGVPVRIIASWYRTPPQDVLVIYDDRDFPFGTLRMRPFGGPGSHNGMKSLVATMGDTFPRLRIGIGRPDELDSIDHVLGAFNPTEQQRLPKIIAAAADGAEIWLKDGIEAAMQFVNTWQIEEDGP